MKYYVVDKWDDLKVVFQGDLEKCIKYIQSNNIYQCGYSKLILQCI